MQNLNIINNSKRAKRAAFRELGFFILMGLLNATSGWVLVTRRWMLLSILGHSSWQRMNKKTAAAAAIVAVAGKGADAVGDADDADDADEDAD